jgi:predicted nuclease of predicted toxin-antitoxin system
MRFLVDANLSPRLCDILTAAGHDAVHVLHLDLLNADDPTILARAKADERIVITADSDFATMLALTGADSPSVVQLRRVNELPTAAVADLLVANLPAVTEHLAQGAIVSLSPSRLAVRDLPIRQVPPD